ncbi:MAG: hypothetical protein M1823_000019 [Watsoniomyces obsoletus]|nr:MAG: hypothetical protein M1823_000019 [Watsoniomyces obsoletus]
MAFASLLGDRKMPTPPGAKESMRKRPNIPSSKSSKFLRPSMFFRGKSGSSSSSSSLLKRDVERSELEELNQSLVTLSALFPDIQVEVLREMLLNTSPESRVQLVAEMLLKEKAKWVRGRWRARDGDKTLDLKSGGNKTRSENGPLTLHERFRTPEYKDAVRAALCQEFKGLPRSTIEAVLAEHNFSYTRARPALLSVSAGSWWYSLSNILLRRKRSQAQDPSEHPSLLCTHTGSAELDQEILETIITPLQKRRQQDQLMQDYALAMQVNEAEAEEHNALYDCECCFISTVYEQLSVCDQSGHWICFRCIRHATTEAIYGQSWTSNIDVKRGTLRCLAPSLGNKANCTGCIDPDFVRRALLEEKEGTHLISQLDEKLAVEELKRSGLPLIRCPFCAYAEADDEQPSIGQLLVQRRKNLSIQNNVLIILVFMMTLFPILLLMTLFIPSFPISTAITHSIARVRLQRRGLKFQCPSPRCLRASCLSCHKEWHDIHICYESERVALREHIERAMVDAIKRTCPRCHLSFVKASGCNKLTCPCGYHMCYICREEIQDSGYRHFCQHFRPLGGGSCGECRKCELYRAEDEDVVVEKAAKRAEKEWLEMHADEIGGAGPATGTGAGGTGLGISGDGEGEGGPNVPWRRMGGKKGEFDIIPQQRTWTEEALQQVGLKSGEDLLDCVVNWLMDAPK